jgi:hypothetical protein
MMTTSPAGQPSQAGTPSHSAVHFAAEAGSSRQSGAGSSSGGSNSASGSGSSKSGSHDAEHARRASADEHGAGPSGTSGMGGFNLDAFDFGADFTLPSSLDELNIFTHSGAHGADGQGGPGPAPHQQHTPGQSHAFAHHSHSNSAPGSVGAPSPASMSHAGRPSTYSPASSHRGAAASDSRGSRHGSPRVSQLSGNAAMAQSGSSNGTSGPAGAAFGGAGSPLANLLMSMSNNAAESASRGSAASPAASNVAQLLEQSGQMQLSIGDIQRMLMEKEQAERLQNMQTAVLRQQLEALQRQADSRGNHGQSSMPSNVQAYALQQLQQQQHQQQQRHQQQQQQHADLISMAAQVSGSNGNTPTQQNPGPGSSAPSPFMNAFSPNAYAQQRDGSAQSPHAQINNPFCQPNMPMSSAMAQYGLMTPVHSGAFNSGQQMSTPYVSCGAGSYGSGSLHRTASPCVSYTHSSPMRR